MFFRNFPLQIATVNIHLSIFLIGSTMLSGDSSIFVELGKIERESKGFGLSSINDTLLAHVPSQNPLHYLHVYSMHLMLHILKGISCLLPAECLFLSRRNTFFRCWSPYWCCLKRRSFLLGKTKSSSVSSFPINRYNSYHNHLPFQSAFGESGKREININKTQVEFFTLLLTKTTIQGTFIMFSPR